MGLRTALKGPRVARWGVATFLFASTSGWKSISAKEITNAQIIRLLRLHLNVTR